MPRRNGRYEVTIAMRIEDAKTRKAAQGTVLDALRLVGRLRYDEEYEVETTDDGLAITVRPIRAATEGEARSKALFKIREAGRRTGEFSWSRGDNTNEGVTVREMEAA